MLIAGCILYVPQYGLCNFYMHEISGNVPVGPSAFGHLRAAVAGHQSRTSAVKKPKTPSRKQTAARRPLVRLNFKLTEKCAGDLARLAEETELSMTEIVRQAIEIRRIAWEEKERNNNTLALIDQDGKTVKEILFI